MNVVLIHGRAQQDKDPQVLQRQWEDALRAGFAAAGFSWPQGLIVAFPYYGDALDDLVERLEAPLIADVVERGAGQDTLEAEFRGELLSEMARAAGVTDAEIDAALPVGVQERGPLNWEWVQAILKVLDRTPLGTPAIDAFTRDVYVYLTYPAVREAIDAIVAAAVPSEPCVVVGHSLGSVVGYNVLRNAVPPTRVRRYVTVGSPLGVRAIQRRLERPLKMPDCVGRWFNAMDERDVVPLYPLDQERFHVSPPIANKTDVRNGTSNRHGIRGYLEDHDVAREIHDGLIGR